MIYERDGQKIVFIHIPKTGGMRIDYHLQEMGFEPQDVKNPYPVCINHLTYNELQRAVRKTDSDEAMEDYFTFTFVRNPYSRMLAHWLSWDNGLEFNPWIMTIQQQLEDDLYAHEAHLRPQTDFLSPHINRIGRLENLEEDFLSILSDVGIYNIELPPVPPDKMNSSDPRGKYTNYHKMYDDETKDVIIQMYHTDLSQFNYRFEINA